MRSNQLITTEPVVSYKQNVVLSPAHKETLRELKFRYRLSNSAVFRLGIELVAKEFAPVMKSQGACLGV